MSRFLKPEVVRIDLSNGDWITIHKRLNYGQDRRVKTRMLKTAYAGERIEIDFDMAELSLIMEYLIDWSITDAEGQPITIRDAAPEFIKGALQNMDPDGFAEIADAITGHIKAMEEEKKTPDYRARIVSDLYICRIMHWTLADVRALPMDVYEILVAELNKESE